MVSTFPASGSSTPVLRRALLCSGINRSVSYQRIHANEEEEAQLRSCYTSVLSLCNEKSIRSVAFPSLGTRGHRYPLTEAAKVGVKTIVDVLKEKGDSFDRVVLCTHNGKDADVIKQTLEACLKEVE